MKRLFIAMSATGLLVACGGGVDREGTRDNVVSAFEDAGLEIDGDCVDGVLDQYTDDELEAIDEASNDDEESPEEAELRDKLLACMPATT
jgi:hypothetical protein